MNYFPTLNDALDSEKLTELWPLGLNLDYGCTARVVKDGTFISVYRDERGMYDRPIHYATKHEDCSVVFKL